MRFKSKNVDMCQGSIIRSMIAYTIPLIFTGILQLLYAAADLVVIGQFDGSNAFAAVGVTNSLYNLFTTFFIAISGGGCICIAQYYGAKDHKNVHETVHTCVLVSIICGVFIALIAGVFIKDALMLMDTHEDVIDMSAMYLRIVLSASPFTLFYNFAAGILRAAGDTKRPFYILVLTGFVNVVLNLILVAVFHLSVIGVAVATTVSNILNALLTALILIKSDDCIKLYPSRLKIYRDKLIKILKYGIPSGIQSCLFSMSNVIIQSAVNSFNSIAVAAGSTAGANIEGFIYTSMNAVTVSTLNFSGQNFGARQYKRVDRSIIDACFIVVVIGVSLGTIANIFADPLLSIYEPHNTYARHVGALRLAFISGPYFLCGLYEVFANALRGIGSIWAPTITSLLSAGLFRVVWVLFVFPHFHNLSTLYIVYPLTWSISLFILSIIYLTTRKKIFAKNDALYTNT